MNKDLDRLLRILEQLDERQEQEATELLFRLIDDKYL